MTLEAGQMLGRYQILSSLGAGGMAQVYKAFHPKLERVVALKVLRRGFADDPEFQQRFLQEAKAVAALHHPNIVQVIDFDEVDDRAFLAMEFLDGITLKARLASLALGDRLAADEIVSIIRQVGDALDHAHASGVIHRDIKPSNLMLTTGGRVVVTDFGIAKMLAAAQGPHTQTGLAIGTPEYMAPEQAAGHDVGPAADRYALGTVAYELLTGRVPYRADTPLAVALAQLRDPLPLPSTIAASVGPRTERILLRALAKDPRDRYPTATAIATALGPAVADDAAERGRARRLAHRLSRRLLLGTGIAIMLVLALGVTLIAESVDTARGSIVTRDIATASPPATPTVASTATPTASANSAVVLTSTPSPAATITPPAVTASVPTVVPTAPPVAVAVPTPAVTLVPSQWLFEARLDGSTSDMPNTSAEGDAAATNIAFVLGEIDLAFSRAPAIATTGTGGDFGSPALPSRAIATLDFAFTPGSSVFFTWTFNSGARGGYHFSFNPIDETVDIHYWDNPKQQSTPISVVPLPGLRTQRVGASVTADNGTYRLLIGGTQVAQFTDLRLTNLHAGVWLNGTGPGTARILGARVGRLTP